jgi:hypothetical protein
MRGTHVLKTISLVAVLAAGAVLLHAATGPGAMIRTQFEAGLADLKQRAERT